jgi:hypothetical protein
MGISKFKEFVLLIYTQVCGIRECRRKRYLLLGGVAASGGVQNSKTTPLLTRAEGMDAIRHAEN